MCHQTNEKPRVPLEGPYNLNVAHSSDVSAVLAAAEEVPHTLLASLLITSPSSRIDIDIINQNYSLLTK